MRSISPRAIVFACLLLMWAIYSMAAEPLRQAVSDYQAGHAQMLSDAD